MRKLIKVAAAAVLLAGAAAGGWWGYHRYFRDPLKVAQELLAKGHYQEAALVLREAVQRDPGNAIAQVRLATVQIALGDAVAAERELRLAQTSGYKGHDLLPKLGEAMLIEKHDRQLLAELSPDGLPPAAAADLWVVRGLADLSLGNIDATRAAAEAAERLNPKSAKALLLAARAAVAQRQPGWALALLDRALTLNPHYSEAMLLKAGVLRAEGRPNEALPVLNDAVQIARAPLDQMAARLSRAGALIATGEDKKAAADLAIIQKLAPKSPAANFLSLIVQVRAKDWHDADATLTKIQPFLSRLPRGEYYQALVKLNIGQLAVAADAIGHYTARVPHDPNGWRLMARIDLAAGRKSDAAAVLARVAGIMPPADDERTIAGHAQTPRELTQLASLQIGSGNFAGASHALDRTLNLLPSAADIAARAVVAALREGKVDRAAAALETLAHTPNVSLQRLAGMTGAVRLAQLDLPGARKAFEDGIKQVPSSVPLKIDLARVLVLQGHAKDAEELLGPLLAAAPASPAVLSTMLDIYTATNQPDRARAAIAAARAAEPHNLNLLLTDAGMVARAGGPKAAIALLDTAPTDEMVRAPATQEMRVALLAQEKRPKDAIQAARVLLQAEPDNLRARQQLIGLLLADKQWTEAIDLVHEGLRKLPGNRTLLHDDAIATLRKSGLDAALKLADDLRKDPANLPASLLLKGDVYFADGRPNDAAAAYAAERKTTPTGVLVIAEAQALHAAGKAAEARKLLAAWVDAQPDAAASDVLASYEIEAKDWKAAATALRQVLAGRPDDAVALNNLAWSDMMLHDPHALALAHRAYLLLPGGQTADTLGWLLTQHGKPEVGLLLLRQAAAEQRHDPSVFYHLAVALNATGDHADAVKVLDQVTADSVHFDDKDAAKQLLQKITAPAAAK